MKLLYYSTSYHASHGGSIQAIEFYKNLDNFPVVTQKQLFPERAKRPFVNGNSKKSLRTKLKNIPLFQVLFFFRRNRFYIRELEEFIRENSPEVIILQIDSNFLQIRQLKEKFPQLLVCSQINGSPFDEPFKNIGYRNYFLKQQQKAYSFADLNFFISDFLRSYIMGREINFNRDIVVQNGTDVQKFRPLKNKNELRGSLNYPKDKFIVGYVGTLDEHKKMEILIHAIANLIPHFPKLHLTIIGAGSALSSVWELVDKLNIGENVELKGWIDHKDINGHINCFDIAIHHHANDYMSPLKIFEYLATGVPVIGPDIPSVREVFSNGEQLLLTRSNMEDITNNLMEIINNPESAEERARRGRIFVKENYTWAHYTEKLIHCIEEKRIEYNN